MKILLHPVTFNAINDFISSPSHALLISGPLGAGKGTLANYIASQVLNIHIDKLSDHPYVVWLHDLEKGVSIDDIRKAQTFMLLKTPGKAKIRRVLIIEQCETMSLEAQNAFLKLLEEPPNDSLIIMTTNSSDVLLPTIRSRTQKLNINAPSLEQTINYFKDKYPESDITKAYYTSEGYIGLLSAILSNEDSHPLVEQILSAKTILSSNTYKKLTMVDEIIKKDNLLLLLQALERVTHAALKQSIATNKPNSKQWNKSLKAILDAKDQLKANVQAKLILTELMLNL